MLILICLEVNVSMTTVQLAYHPTRLLYSNLSEYHNEYAIGTQCRVIDNAELIQANSDSVIVSCI